ncbi:MAG: V-type ATP synthase subunit D [Candidatus Omnitrophica bacterium]|nr:V-type ATP synthase subunit D [Candidatus Omnitrophota bacterium]
MAKIKLTKGELKRQRDALKQYKRYLPTLQLKKQQLQLEILHQGHTLEEKKSAAAAKKEVVETWAGLLSDPAIDMRAWVTSKEVITGVKNIAGVDLPLFSEVHFKPVEYDLFTMPLWVDGAILELRALFSMHAEIEVLEKAMKILKQELRITTQRVNLFEKVKIPEAEEIIRLIKIYMGDQMTNAVGRSKIAKRKIELSVLEGVGA